MTVLTRTDIFSWADTKHAEGQLPELIRRLVVASNQTLNALVMPYGDSVGRSGLDGYIHAGNASTYIPDGESVWELGTNKNHVSKANSDFKKRTSGTAASTQQRLSYLFVTPRHWEKKAEWEKDPGPTKDKVIANWKAVRVFDVDDILGWLSDCPCVEAWFSRMLGKAVAGLRDAEGYWENIATTEAGSVSPRILLAGRDELKKQVLSHLAKDGGNPRPMGISSRSPAEVLPFAVASVVDSGDLSTIVGSLVVDSRERWEQAIVESTDLGLIVAPQVQPTREQLQQAASRDHRVVYCSSSGETELPRLTEFDVRKALISSGICEADAKQHAIQCGGNGQLLLDRLSGLHEPAGSIGSSLDDRVKVTCLLLVGWNGNHPADREVFSILSGLPYEEIEASLVSDSNDPYGLLFRADGKFRLLSPELAWIRYASLITKSVVESFSDVIRYLLADDDPTAGMSSNERLTAQFLGKHPEFSGTLRKNVVHSLAIAASIGAARLKLDPSMSPSFVEWIVRSTLEAASFSRWASFGSELSILAEAAPDALLDALEHDARPEGPLAEVMDKSRTGLLDSPAHTGILWAIERLCWSQDHLARAISILLKLAKLNPEIESGNNPSNSIRETLQLCCPQTNADWPMRQDAISRMLNEDAETAFGLVISLFPSGLSSWACRELPTWRDWAQGYDSNTTYLQVGTERRWCVEQLLLFAADDAERWSALIELCGDIEDEQYVAVLNDYESKLADGVFDQVGKRLLWETINAMLIAMEWNAAQRRLENGDVVDVDEIGDSTIESEQHFPGEVRRYQAHGSRLRNLLNASTPEDPVLAGCHAFLSGLNPNHCTRHFSDRFNHEKQQELITESRRSIVESVWRLEGLAGLFRLAAIEHVDSYDVGRALANSEAVQIEPDELLPFFSSDAKTDRLLASGFIAVWSWDRKDSLTTEVLPLLSMMPSDDSAASYLQCLPLVPEVWDSIDRQSEIVQAMYWKNASIPWEIPQGRLPYFVKNLNQVGRADRSLDLLTRRRVQVSEDAADLVFETLEALPFVERDRNEGNHGSLRWEIQQLFKTLYKIGMSQIVRLVRLELAYHEVFENDESRKFQPKGLLVAIRDDPSLFVELLAYPWKDDTGASATQGNEQARAQAKQVGGLLRQVAELPGQSELCPMSGRSIADWITEVTRIATERRYLTAVGLQLPSIIASGAWSSIETWPTPEVVDAINVLAEAAPQTFPRHLSVSLSNARGVHFVDPTGESEKSQAEKLGKRAGQLRQTCPAASRALRDMAQSLESEALRNIEQAKWER